MSEFKVGDLVKYEFTNGLIREVKRIDGRSILKDYVLYLVELEGKGLEWINEIYLKKV